MFIVMSIGSQLKMSCVFNGEYKFNGESLKKKQMYPKEHEETSTNSEHRLFVHTMKLVGNKQTHICIHMLPSTVTISIGCINHLSPFLNQQIWIYEKVGMHF